MSNACVENRAAFPPDPKLLSVRGRRTGVVVLVLRTGGSAPPSD